MQNPLVSIFIGDRFTNPHIELKPLRFVMEETAENEPPAEETAAEENKAEHPLKAEESTVCKFLGMYTRSKEVQLANA